MGKFEHIVLTKEQDALRGNAKKELYECNYIEMVKRMKTYNIKFPADPSGQNNYGINGTEFSKWCGIRQRQTLHNNSFIQKRLARDIAKIGIDNDATDKSITEKKSNDMIARQVKDINDIQKDLVVLSSRVDTLTEEVSIKDELIKALKSELAQSRSTYNTKMAAHSEQVQNSILTGGRTFEC
ncbi:MAG: hypothetical protein HRT44_10295 [Bdellovibrionales bacterium]|nr:hypothetical protein [Bdellovibrionales bacterium]